MLGGMTRLDVALVERGLCPSREQAKRAILAGQVRVNAQPARKPSDPVGPDDRVELLQAPRYVSRGGYKLEHALRQFGLDVQGAWVLDVGASTGGFTDCLLQHGAARVYAVDVGRGQLAWKLRQDPRVVVMDNTNARYLSSARFPPPFRPLDGAVIDCSFISLRQILPAVAGRLRPGAWLVALVKPQFEAGKAEADKGRGVITDPSVHQRVLDQLQQFVQTQTDLHWRAVTQSPLPGPAGNKEFLVWLEKTS